MSAVAPDPEKIKQAALAWALGVCRGALNGVLEGDFTADDIRRAYDATSAFRIAETIGLSVEIDWNDYLTDAQKHQITGHDVA